VRRSISLLNLGSCNRNRFFRHHITLSSYLHKDLSLFLLNCTQTLTIYPLKLQLSPWNRVLLEKLIVAQLLKNFSPPSQNQEVHYSGHRTSSLAPLLSQLNPIHVFTPNFTISVRLISILSFHLCLDIYCGRCFQTLNSLHISHLTTRVANPIHCIFLDFIMLSLELISVLSQAHCV
jgi:hypothetical protein